MGRQQFGSWDSVGGSGDAVGRQWEGSGELMDGE